MAAELVLAVASTATHVRELTIVMDPCSGGSSWEMRGNSIQLEAEGVIPREMVWPIGIAALSWEVGRFEYLLQRTRPPGDHRPMKEWLAGDWWKLICMCVDGDVRLKVSP